MGFNIKKYFFIGLACFAMACSSSRTVSKNQARKYQAFQITGIYTEASYRLTSANPVKVGGVD
jgi:hypothetical protein